jgi:hypothetical protein
VTVLAAKIAPLIDIEEEKARRFLSHPVVPRCDSVKGVQKTRRGRVFHGTEYRKGKESVSMGTEGPLVSLSPCLMAAF